MATLRARVDHEIVGALKLALNRTYQYHDKRLPRAAEDALVEEATHGIGLVLDTWLDWSDGT